jgi:hypothetical protein
VKKILFVVTLLCAVSMFGPSPSGAVSITIDFEGKVSYFSAPQEFLNDVPVSIDDVVVGSWTYETGAEILGDSIIRPNVSFFFNIYDKNDPADLKLTFEWSGEEQPYYNDGYAGDIFDYHFIQSVDVTYSGTSGPIRGTEFESSMPFSLQNDLNWVPLFGQMSFDPISGTHLPETLAVQEWTLEYLSWIGPGAAHQAGIHITPTWTEFDGAADPVPEPGTLLLLGSGLLGVWGAGRKFKA